MTVWPCAKRTLATRYDFVGFCLAGFRLCNEPTRTIFDEQGMAISTDRRYSEIARWAPAHPDFIVRLFN